MHPLPLRAAEQMAVGLGVIKDGCKVAVSATEIGFGIAKAATAWGIWIARTAVRGTAAATDFAVPDNPVGGILRAVDTTIGMVQKIRTELQFLAGALSFNGERAVITHAKERKNGTCHP